MLEISLIRHGEIVRPKPDSLIGQLDVFMSDVGRRGVNELAKKIAQKQFEAIFTSPLSRCIESARIICNYQQEQPLVVDCLKEIALGEWDGLSKRYIKEKYSREFDERGQNFASFMPPGGESFIDLQERAWPCFFNIVKSCYKKKYQKIAIIAHAGVNRVIISKITNASLTHIFSIKQNYACCTPLMFDGRNFTIDPVFLGKD